jgi:Peptidase M15
MRATARRAARPLLVLGSLLAGSAVAAGAFDPGLAGMSVEVQGLVLPYRVFAVYLLPAEKLHIEVLEPELRAAARLTVTWGDFRQQSPGSWNGAAPATPGLFDASVESGERRIDLHVFVMLPFSAVRNASLNGYRMGNYPTEPLRGLPVYRTPRGFIEVTPGNLGTPLAPHFTLGQFPCKQAGGFPKYVAVQERLLLKLEHLLALVNAKGHPAETFFVMSGYRTPAYNAAIGNVRYSRHQWGDAADIFIDERPRDGVMDDLNGDGRSDLQDALLLFELFNADASRGPRAAGLPGGLGLYGTTATHGPFVHVDTRGFRARWGR